MLDGLERFVSGRPVSERQAQWTRMILAIEEEASASPPATETGGLDVGLLAEAIHAAEDPHLEGVSLKQREKAAIIVAEYSRLRSPSVGEDARE